VIDQTGKLLENCGSGLKRLWQRQAAGSFPHFFHTLATIRGHDQYGQFMTSSPERHPLWYSSFFWRIAISFVVFVAVVLVGQSVMVSTWRARPTPGLELNAATTIATDVGRELARQPDLDLTAYLRAHHGGVRQAAYIVMKDGRAGGNSSVRSAPTSAGRPTRS
jgi:hypothetical protein